MESNTEMQAHRSLTNMSMKKLQKLVKTSFSNKHHLTNPPIQPKPRLISDENTPPTDPNIQPIEPYFSLLKTPKSPTKPSDSHKQLVVSRSDCHDDVQSLPDPPVKVIVRIKPADSKERIGDRTVEKVSDVAMRVGDREFIFDSVLDSNSKQEDVFRLVGVPLVKDALAGYNASILSYGQTGSGKTYTMWGPPSAMIECHNGSNQQGIVPRIFQMMFTEIHREKENSDGKQINYQCRCSFLEIHDGHIGDLLDTTQRNLEIKDDTKNGFYVESLTEEYVTSYDDVTQILIKGLSNRKLGATSMNSKSSRSHVVFTCIIESWCKETTSNSFSSSKTSRISLVDLAGVEKLKHDDPGRDFNRPGKIMKKSISNLGHLVSILAKGTQPEDFAFKSSCLTHLLQESLGGNAKLSVICTISPDQKNYSETLSTLRFGQRLRSIKNNPAVNEITEDDVNDLSDQIRQLKEELLRAKLDVCKPTRSSSGQFNGRSARESVNQLRISLNRSLMLPSIDNDLDEEVVANEDDVDELCKQLDNMGKSCEENSGEFSCEDSMNFASARGSCDTYFTSEHETTCLHESEEVNSGDTLQITNPSSRSIVASPCNLSTVLEDPTLSESPKIIPRKSIANSLVLMDNQNVSESSKLNLDSSRKSVRQSEHQQSSSLRSSRIFSGPAESLAASLKRGLEIIDCHQQNSATTRSSVAFSFEHLMLKPSPAADKANASVQTLAEQSPSLLCASCQQKVQDGSNDIQDSLNTSIVEANEVGNSNCSTQQMYKDAGEDATQTNSRYKELENVCNEQASKIEELNLLVEQFKHKREYCSGSKQSKEVEDKEPEIIKETCEIEELHHENVNAPFDMREKEELLKEIQELKRKLQTHTDAAANKSIEKLRSSLSRSLQFQKILSARNNNVEDMEKERLRWTEMESEWISLTDELRIDLESSRQHAEKIEMELKLEKKCTEELDDALHRAILGHARIVEHYVELQEKYNDLSEKHQRIMEGVAEVKRAAAKAGAKGRHGSRFAKVLAAELSAERMEKEKERERLKKENKSLRIQLRDTAEAVQTAGELLVRLREAEEAASVAEANLSDAQQENDRLKKQIEKLKRKHKMEMITMKQYLAESKLPEAALRPLHYEDTNVLPTSTFTEADDDQAWRAEFRATYQDHY